MRQVITLYALIIFTACTGNQEVDWNEVFSSSLFHDVQMNAVFPDSKTFPDCTPRSSWKKIIERYEKSKKQPGFNLTQFVKQNFELPERPATVVLGDTVFTLDAHLQKLWPMLTRTADKVNTQSSRLPLPYPYIVPGGRFSEIYYWDSYFTMLGLMEHERYDDIRNMLNNFAFLIRQYHHVPNGNRVYYLSRSQPPFFACMVDLLQRKDSSALVQYMPALRKEYGFWMIGEDKLAKPGDCHRRVFRNTGKMMEKYNVQDTTLEAGGGEYPSQDGFGWTNGVAAFLINQRILQ